MKKITFLMLHLNYGGLEKQTITLINELAKSNEYDITILSVYDMLDNKSFYDIDPKVKVEFLSSFGPNHKAFYNAIHNFKIFSIIKESLVMLRCGINKTLKLKRYIKNLNTDVIVSSRIEFSKQIKREDTLNISQEHSYIATDKYINKVKKYFKHIHKIVVMTQKAKEDYISWLIGSNSKAKVYNISNMIEEGNTENIASFSNKKIVSVGRLEKEKDFLTLIDVFEIVHKKINDVTLNILGEGSQRELLEEKIKEKNLEEYVKLPGRVTSDKVENYLLNSSVFALTSLCESFSLVLCEAMEKGLPCVSFNIDVGPKEIIQNGENGFLIDNRDINSMADKIIELLEDKEKWEDISKKSKERVKKYYSQNVVEEWKKIL